MKPEEVRGSSEYGCIAGVKGNQESINDMFRFNKVRYSGEKDEGMQIKTIGSKNASLLKTQLYTTRITTYGIQWLEELFNIHFQNIGSIFDDILNFFMEYCHKNSPSLLIESLIS